MTVSRLNHLMGSIRLEDLQSERGYGRWRACNQSKLAKFMPAGEDGGWPLLPG